jgi:hypothetical protein
MMYRQNAVVADVAASRGFIDIKRAALIFDTVVVLKTRESATDPIARTQRLPGLGPDELDWLTENNVVSFVEDYSSELFESNDLGLQKQYGDYRRACLGHALLLNKKSAQYEDFIRASANFVARYSASRMQEIDEGKRIVPLLYEPRYELGRLGAQFEFPYANEAKGNYGRTTAVVLSEFPVPDALTPWEDIFKFRQERKNKLAFFALREWISQATRTDISPTDLKDWNSSWPD